MEAGAVAALGHVAMVWPMQALKVGGQPFYSPKKATTEDILLLPVFDIDGWELQELDWWSPLHAGSISAAGPMGVVAVPRGKPCDALQLAASRAFWSLPRSYLESLCLTRGWALQPSLFDLVKHMVLQVLGDMEEEKLYGILFPSGMSSLPVGHHMAGLQSPP